MIEPLFVGGLPTLNLALKFDCGYAKMFVFSNVSTSNPKEGFENDQIVFPCNSVRRDFVFAKKLKQL